MALWVNILSEFDQQKLKEVCEINTHTLCMFLLVWWDTCLQQSCDDKTVLHFQSSIKNVWPRGGNIILLENRQGLVTRTSSCYRKSNKFPTNTTLWCCKWYYLFPTVHIISQLLSFISSFPSDIYFFHFLPNWYCPWHASLHLCTSIPISLSFSLYTLMNLFTLSVPPSLFSCTLSTPSPSNPF